MSGILNPYRWRGRGGIRDPRRRILPIARTATEVSFPGQPGGDDLPAGVDLWGVWNSYRQSGDTFVPGGAYSVQVDQSGNERDLTALGSAPDASALIYPGHLGSISVPECTGGARLATVNDPPDGRLESFMLVTLSPWNADRNNQSSEWVLSRSTRASVLFGMRLTTGPVEITCNWDGDAGFVGPSISLPSVGEGDTTSWMLQAVRSSSTGSGGTATYRFVVLYDIGAGAVLAGDESFSETASLTGTTDSRRSSWRGIHSTGVGEKPLATVYTGSDDDTFEAAIIAAAGQYSAGAAVDVAALL